MDRMRPVNIFRGTLFDIYIHWLILSLGISVLVSGVAVLTSCRSVAGYFYLLKVNTSGGTRFYRSFYKYHSIYWVIFWYALALHLLVAAIHVGLPSVVRPYFFAHQAVFFTALGNLAFMLAVLSSCRSFASILNFFTSGSPLTNNVYKRFYRFHSYFWWLLAVSLGGHVVFGLIHAINT